MGEGSLMAIFTAIAGYLTTTLVGLGLSTVVAGAVANIAIGAALLGIGQLASAAFAGSRSQTSTPQAQATINQSTGPRIRGYGRAKLGGTRAFWESRNGALFQAVMMHSGEIDAVEQYYIGDKPVGVDGNGIVVDHPFFDPARGRYYAYIDTFLGGASQGASSRLIGTFPELWTAEHRLRGIAYFVSAFQSPNAEDYQVVFPDGYNTPVKAICRLSKVFDPRDGQTVWSENASLCILDYLTHPDGYNRSLDDIDLQSFASFANICNVAIPLAGGGVEMRYRLWGVYGLNDDPQDVLAKMRAACDAELYQTAEGKIGIRGGVWEAPSVTISAEDIIGHSMEQGNNRFSAFNELKILYTSKDHDFQTMEAPAWENLADQADRGVLSSSLNLDMVPSGTQARRLAKIHISKSNPEWKGTIVANLSALNALGERTVRLILPELEIDDAFFIAGFSIRPDLTGVEISVMSISEAAYTWTTAEEGVGAPIPEDTSPDLTFPVPTGLSLTKPSAGNILATADVPDREGLTLQVQVRAGAGAIWQEMQSRDDGISAQIAGLASGSYEARARWRGALSSAGAWTFPYASITI